jgi:hypothetical protein
MIRLTEHSAWCSGCRRGFSLGERSMPYSPDDLARVVLAEVSQGKEVAVLRSVLTPAYVPTQVTSMAITRIKEHVWRILAGTRDEQYSKMKALSKLLTAKVRYWHHFKTARMCQANYV